jgi:hypothetical protein
MQRRLFINVIVFTAVILVSAAACRKNNAANVDPHMVNLYACNAKASNAVPYICFDSLLFNCLCPANMECIWSGYALIKTTFHENGNTHTFKMIIPNLKNFGGVNDTTINGYRIVFKDLQPNSINPLPADIKAVIEITK